MVINLTFKSLRRLNAWAFTSIPVSFQKGIFDKGGIKEGKEGTVDVGETEQQDLNREQGVPQRNGSSLPLHTEQHISGAYPGATLPRALSRVLLWERL